MQEQQGQQTKVWNPNSMSLEQKLSDFKQWKQNTDTHYAAQKDIDMDNDTKKLYEGGLKVNDRETKKKYDIASRGNLLAQMVTKVAETNGVALTGNATDRVSAYLQGFPDDYQAFYDFTHGDQDPEEFGVQMGWIKQKKEKSVYDLLTGDEGDSSLVGRSVNGLLGTVIGSGEGVLNAMKRVYNNMGDIKEIANDDRPFIDKFNEILFGEIIGDSIGGSVGDIIGGMMEGGFKGITKQSERDRLNNKVGEFVQKAMDSDTGQDVVEFWNGLSEDDKDYVKKYLGYGEGLLNLLGLKGGKAVAKPVEQGFKKVGGLVDGVAGGIGSKTTGGSLISKAIDKEILPSAGKTIQSMNKLTKGKSIEFQKKFGKPHGDWLNERGIVEGEGDTVEKLADYTAKNKAKVDEGLASIKGIIESSKTNEALHEMADDVARYVEEVSVTPSEIRKYKTLAEKAKTEGLTMEEINDVKRYYESHNKFAYGMDKTAAEKTERATNIDNAVRERQIEEAAKRGFTNLRELNKETSASKWLTNELGKELKGKYGNDSFTLSDYLVVGNLSPENIALLGGKKILNTVWFKKKYVDVINKIKRHENIEEKLVDLETISKINNEKDLEKWLASDYNTPKLGYKPDVEGKDFVEHIIADDKGNNARINNGIVLDRN